MIRLATSPQPHSAIASRSILGTFKVNNLTAIPPRTIPAPRPDPDPEPNPEPDSALHAGDIAPADWDVLFDAVTARLQLCAGLSPLEPSQGQALGMTVSLQATVRDCVLSMNLLHAALPHDWQQGHWH